MSGRFTPAAATFTNTSPSPGRGTGRSTSASSSAPSGCGATTAFMVAGTELLTAGGLLTSSEEHTSELQSLMRISYAVFCLKKKIEQLNKHTRSYGEFKY